MLRSLIHMNWSFEQHDKHESINILLHAEIQLDQNHLLTKISVFPLYSLDFFAKNQMSIGMWVYSWVFSCIPLINLLHFCQHTEGFITIAW